MPSSREAPDPSRETLAVKIDLAGEPLTLQIHPDAVLRLCVHRYCAGGWAAVFGLRDAISESLRATTGAAFAAPSALYPQPAPSEESRLAVSRAVTFGKRTAEAIASLELCVRAVLLQAAVDALHVARERIPQVRARFEADRARYAITPTEVDRGPSDMRPGRENVYADHPEVDVTGSQTQARALARAVTDLSERHRTIVWTRLAVYAAQTRLAQEGAEGRSGRDDAEPPVPDPVGEKKISAAEQAFLRLLKEPAGHPLAPVVFALLKGKNETVDAIGRHTHDEIVASEEITKEVWSSAYVYLRDTLDLLEHLVVDRDDDYPFDALEERLGISLDALSVIRPPRTIDTPELRAAYWSAQRVRANGYEPFDDEAILLHLLDAAEREMQQAAGDSPSASAVAALFTRRVLTELISARETSSAIVALAEKASAASGETLNRVAGVLGVLGLLFPPARIAAAGLGTVLLLGSAVDSIRDVETQQRLNGAFGISALMNSDEATYATSLISKPSVAAALVPLFGPVLAFSVFHNISQEFANTMALFMDLQAIAPSGAEAEELADAWLTQER